MRPELNRLQHIEQLLLGPATPAQGADRSLQLLLDPELAADVEAQRLAYQALHHAGRRQLRHELIAIHHKLYGPRGTGLLTGLRAILARGRRKM